MSPLPISRSARDAAIDDDSRLIRLVRSRFSLVIYGIPARATNSFWASFEFYRHYKRKQRVLFILARL